MVDTVKKVSKEEWDKLLSDQDVQREHLAFKCPMCGNIQSATDLISVGAGKTFDEVSGYINFSCVGRWTNKDSAKGWPVKGQSPCNWTLGGLFSLHKMEVVLDDGTTYPTFEPCTKEEAQQHKTNQPKEIVMSSIEILGLNDYQEKALRTLKPAKDSTELRLHAAMGLAGEASEHLKCCVAPDPISGASVAIIELGDTLWYLPVMCESFGLKLDDVYMAGTDYQVSVNPEIQLVILTGTILDAVKKEVFYGKAPSKEAMVELMGQILKVASTISVLHGITLIEVMRLNIIKLAKRFPDAFSAELAINKDEEAENATVANS